jgi:hypothetical protein
MIKINFKENFKESISDKVSNLISNPISNQVDKVIEEPSIVSGPLHTDKYEELIELIKEESKKHIIVKKQKGENLFSANSVITTLAFLITSVLINVDVALADNVINSRETMQIAITLVGAISTIAARGSEGSSGVYTPNFMPGLNKEDYDLNNNGIDDRHEN